MTPTLVTTRLELMRPLVPNSVGAEVGVHYGHFAHELVKLGPRRVHLVDCWKHQPVGIYIDPCNSHQDQQDQIYQSCMDLHAGDIASGQVVVQRQFSLAAARSWTGPKLDWVYLDANHSFEAVYQDLWAWAAILKPDGQLLGHDYVSFPTSIQRRMHVVEAVTTFCLETSWRLTHLTSDDEWPSFRLSRS